MWHLAFLFGSIASSSPLFYMATELTTQYIVQCPSCPKSLLHRHTNKAWYKHLSFLLKYFNSSNTKLSLTFLHVILSPQSTSVLSHSTSSFFPNSSCLRFSSGASISSSGALWVFAALAVPSWVYLWMPNCAVIRDNTLACFSCQGGFLKANLCHILCHYEIV